MKQNSAYPNSAPGTPRPREKGASNHGPVQHEQHQHQHQQPVGYCQLMQPVGGSWPHQPQHPQRFPAIYQMSRPLAAVMHQPPFYAYQQQQPVQMSSGISSAAGSMHANMSQPNTLEPMVTSPGGFLAPAVWATGHQPQQQQLMMGQQQALGPTGGVNCYGNTGHTGDRQHYKQQQQSYSSMQPFPFQYLQQQQQQQQPSYGSMQPFPTQYHQKQQVQSFASTQPEGSTTTTTDAQYFLDPNCTMPIGKPQSQPPSAAGCCPNPKCSKCEPFKRT